MNPETVVLITGTSSGFGRLIAETLARKNHYVFATMRAIEDKNAAAARDLEALALSESLRLKVLELDVTDDQSVERAVESILAETRRIDVLINNAGYALYGLTEACTLDQAQRIFETNFFGVVRMNRAVLPSMRRNGSGLLIHISSGAGRGSLPGLGLYSASKFALEALAEAYHYELAPQGIDSVIIEPGAYGTAIFRKSEEALDEVRNYAYGPANEIPRRLFNTLAASKSDPQDVADCVARMIEMPAGSRPLRATVGLRLTDSVRRLNYASELFMKEFLETTKIAELTVFRK